MRPSSYLSNLRPVLRASVTVLLAGASAQAATLTWGAATTMSADTDVLTTDALDRAYIFAGSGTVNGVSFTSFQANTLGDFTGSGMTNFVAGAYSPNSGPTFPDYTNLGAAYQVIANNGVYSGDGNGSLTLNSLNVGLDYQIQLWVNDSRDFGPGTIDVRTETITAGNASPALDFNVQNGTGGVGQFVTGTFTADATSQALVILANQSAQLNAMQLRAIGVAAGNTATITTPLDWSALSIGTGGLLRYSLTTDFTQSTVLSGAGSLEKAGAGTLTLNGTNTHAGGTTISAGVLQAGSNTALGANGGGIVVASGASLDINGRTLQGYTQNISIAGAGANASLGALGNSGGGNQNAIRGITLTADASIGGDGGRWDIGRLDFDADPNSTVNHIDGGGFVLTKVGSTYLGLLTGATNLAGFVINGGTVAPHENTAFGAGPVTLNAGILQPWAGLNIANALTLNGGTIQTDGFSDNYNGPITVNAATTINPNAGNVTFNGNVSGAGAISKTGGNFLVLAGNNTQTGTLTIGGGHVRFGSATGNATNGNVELVNPGSFLLMNAPNQFGPNAGLIFNSSGGHNEFALYGNDQTIASLASTSGFAVVQNSHGTWGAATASSTLTVNQSTDTAYSGILRNNTGNDAFTLALVKSGGGKLTITSVADYTGGTTVNGGVLEISGQNGGTGAIRGTVTVNAGGELRSTGGGGAVFGYSNGVKIDTLNINGGLVNNAVGVNHLWNATVNMTAGELRTNGGVSDPNGAQFEWGNTAVNTSASPNTATISGRIRIRPDSNPNITFTVADGAATTDLLVSAAITEAGTSGITKTGAGVIRFTGANNYTGNTNVNGGTLTLAGSGNIGTGSGATLAVGNGALFKIQDSATATFSVLDIGSGNGSAGNVEQTGGTLTYTGNGSGNSANFRIGHWPSETSTYALSGGTLNSTAGEISVGWDGTGIFNQSGGVANILGLRVGRGTGTLTLTGGTLNVGAGGIYSTGSATIDLGDGIVGALAAWNSALNMTLTGTNGATTFDTTGGDIALSGSLGGSGGLIKTSAGTLTFSGANSFTGATTVSAGVLKAAATDALGGTTGVTINSGGTLLLSGAGTDRIKNSTPITMAGGTIAFDGSITEGSSPGTGALTLTANSIIDFGGGNSTINFGDSHLSLWTVGTTLSIYHWDGLLGGGGNDQLLFGIDSSALTPAQLGQISFFSGSGSGFLGTAVILGNGEVAPVPEPSAFVGALGLLGLVGWRGRRRVRG